MKTFILAYRGPEGIKNKCQVYGKDIAEAKKNAKAIFKGIHFNKNATCSNMLIEVRKGEVMKNNYPVYTTETPDYDITQICGSWMARIKPTSPDYNCETDVAKFYTKRDAVRWVCQVLSMKEYN